MEEKVVVKRPPKSPFLAGLLAFFVPGTGAFYNGQMMKGFVYVIVAAGLITLQTTGEGQPFLGIILGGFYIYQIIDSIQIAGAINRRALKIEEEEIEIDEFPQLVKSGSIFWGLVLLALGVVLLLANFEVIDYGALFDFWPVVVIVIGLKFIVDYMTKKNGPAES